VRAGQNRDERAGEDAEGTERIRLGMHGDTEAPDLGAGHAAFAVAHGDDDQLRR
jgi:hypothetical protein